MVMKLIRKIKNKVYLVLAGNLKYARKIGVNMQGKVYIYGKVAWVQSHGFDLLPEK